MNTTETIYALSQVWQGTNRVYPYFDRLPVNWNEAYREYIELALAEQDERQRMLLPMAFCALLNDGHSCALPPRDSARVPIAVRDGILYAAEDTSLLGSAVIGLDDMSWTEWEMRLRKYVHSSQGHFYRGRAERVLPLLLEGEHHALRTSGGDLPFALGPEKMLQHLPEKELFQHGELICRENTLTVRRLPEEKVLYVKIDHFLSAKAVDTACTFLREGSPRGVILDVRDNMGGMTAYAARMAGLFFAGNFSGCRKWTRKSSAVDVAAASQEEGMDAARIARYIADGLMTREDYEASRRIFTNCDFEEYQDHFTGTGELADTPCVLLTSRDTFSAAEDFTAFFKSNGRAKLVGQDTYGSSGTPMILRMGKLLGQIVSVGYRLLDGTEFINRGIQADVPATVDELEEKALSAL